MNTRSKLFALISTFLLAGTLSACGSSSTTQKGEATSATRQVTDTFGHKIEVPKEPKRIIGSYLEDYLVALDEKPVAQWTVGSGSIQDYLQKELKGVPTISFDLPYEKVLSFKPDLLLMSSSASVEGGKYDQYQKIAPTYVVKNGNDVTWEDQLLDIGHVLDKKEQAKAVIKDYDQFAEKTKKELANKIKGKSAAILWVTNNSAFMVSEKRSSGRIVYGDLGFDVPSLVQEVSKSATSDWSAVSAEKLASLDADYLILVNSDKGAAMFNEQTWKNLKAVKNDQVIEMSPESSWLYNGPIASHEMIQDLKEHLEK